MFGMSHSVERRCNACDTTWLLTRKQARFSTRRLRRPRSHGLGVIRQRSAPQVADALALIGSEMMSDTNEMLRLHDALRSCPRCQSEDFRDRKVTSVNPASPDASRTELP